MSNRGGQSKHTRTNVGLNGGSEGIHVGLYAVADGFSERLLGFRLHGQKSWSLQKPTAYMLARHDEP